MYLSNGSDFVKLYFGCLECRGHFLKMAANIDSEVAGIEPVRLKHTLTMMSHVIIAGRGDAVVVASAQSRELEDRQV